MVELLGRLNKDGKGIAESPIPPARLASCWFAGTGAISGKMARSFSTRCTLRRRSGGDPEGKGGQITDAGELEAIVRAVVEKHAGPVAEYRGARRRRSTSWSAGDEATKGKANPKLVNELLKKVSRREIVRLSATSVADGNGCSRRGPETPATRTRKGGHRPWRTK